MSEKTCPITQTACIEKCAWYVRIFYIIEDEKEEDEKRVKKGCSLQIIAKALESLDRNGIVAYQRD